MANVGKGQDGTERWLMRPDMTARVCWLELLMIFAFATFEQRRSCVIEPSTRDAARLKCSAYYCHNNNSNNNAPQQRRRHCQPRWQQSTGSPWRPRAHHSTWSATLPRLTCWMRRRVWMLALRHRAPQGSRSPWRQCLVTDLTPVWVRPQEGDRPGVPQLSSSAADPPPTDLDHSQESRVSYAHA